MKQIVWAALVTWMTSGEALAGNGPWVLGAGDQQVYVGLDAQRLGNLAVSSGSYADDVIQVDQGVTTLGGKLIGTFGLNRLVEVELELPYQYAFQNDPGPVCEAVGLDACEPTHGVGVIVARGKVLLLDELLGKPLSISLGLDVRFGQPTFRFRERITNLGEGTFDIEPRLSLGRIGGLGGKGGYFSIYGDVGFRWRFPIDKDYGEDGLAIPGWELTGNLESLFTPTGLVSIGPAVGVLWRPVGVDFEDVDLADPNRFAALRILALDAGAKLLIRSGRSVTFALGVFHTIYAENNPQDVLKVSLGVAFRDLIRRRED